MKIVLISDTHGMHRQLSLPAGDLLIHAGDLTPRGRVSDVAEFNDWLAELPFKHKIVIAGNHDWCFETIAGDLLINNAIYLQDSSVTIEGIKFYGSPWQPRFCNWAFNLDRGAPLREKWQLIPADTDVLITHGPPLGFGDLVYQDHAVGCEELIKVVDRVRPRLHVFGHIHEGYGLYEQRSTIFANASLCTLQYQPINPPLVVEL